MRVCEALCRNTLGSRGSHQDTVVSTRSNINWCRLALGSRTYDLVLFGLKVLLFGLQLCQSFPYCEVGLFGNGPVLMDYMLNRAAQSTVSH